MQLLVDVLSVWLILQCGVNSVSDVTDREFIEDCVKAHNRARSSVEPPARDMLQMTWDEGLAVTATAWAKKCIFKQNIAGENIWVGELNSGFTVADAIGSWVDEKGDYDYKSNSCRNNCGHYRQVVWASSHKVGCAVQQCVTCPLKNRKKAFLVCHYDPVGNVDGTHPYNTGEKPCAACDGVCVERLCRDAQKLDPADSGCGRSCVAVVAVRPLALICSFLVAYAVQRLYPNIYCYE